MLLHKCIFVFPALEPHCDRLTTPHINNLTKMSFRITNSTKFEKFALDLHNEYRKSHGVPEVILDQKLSHGAKV